MSLPGSSYWAKVTMMEAYLTITCGIDWAENHHDVALVDEAGKLVAKRRISDDVQGYQQLLALLAESGDSAGSPSRSRLRPPAAC